MYINQAFILMMQTKTTSHYVSVIPLLLHPLTPESWICFVALSKASLSLFWLLHHRLHRNVIISRCFLLYPLKSLKSVYISIIQNRSNKYIIYINNQRSIQWSARPSVLPNYWQGSIFSQIKKVTIVMTAIWVVLHNSSIQYYTKEFHKRMLLLLIIAFRQVLPGDISKQW